MSVTATKVLTSADLRSLSTRSNLRGAIQVGVLLLLIGAAGWLVAISGPFTLLPAMLLLGISQAALFAPIHETMHQTAFASRRANAIVGWLAACPSLLNRDFYTVFHIAHHRFTQDPDRDPELLSAPPSTLNGYVFRVLAVPYWRMRLTVLWNGLRGDLSAYPYVAPSQAPRVILSLRAMAAFVLACAILSIVLAGWWAPLVFWIGPQLLGQPFLRAYLLVEHTDCSLDDNGLTNTRTTLTNRLVRLLMWNMSYHAEHHLYPAIPFHLLPSAHQVIREKLGVVQDGYVSWHAAFVRRLRTS